MNEVKKLKKPSSRRRARELTTQALYSWDLSKNPVEIIELNFFTDEENDLKNVDVTYFRKLLRGTVEQIDVIDEIINLFIDRPFVEIDPIEKAILRFATYELKFELDVPYKVVINEGIEVAKVFGGEESHKYINGILDKIAIHLAKI